MRSSSRPAKTSKPRQPSSKPATSRFDGALRYLFQTYRNFYTSEDPKGYISARLDDQANRRAKFASTVLNAGAGHQERRRRSA